jgi:hypothetical protein
VASLAYLVSQMTSVVESKMHVEELSLNGLNVAAFGADIATQALTWFDLVCECLALRWRSSLASLDRSRQPMTGLQSHKSRKKSGLFQLLCP